MKRLRDELALPVVSIERVQRGPSGKAAGTLAWSAQLVYENGAEGEVGSEDTMMACVKAQKLAILRPSWGFGSVQHVSVADTPKK